MTSPRRVALEGPLNFRDVGGYATAEGHRVRWGRVFRSDSLKRVSPADVAHLVGEIGIATIIDLRADEELARAGGGLLHEQGIEYRQLPMFDRTAHPQALKDVTLFDFYIRAMRGAGPRVVRVLDAIAERCDRPVVFHCAAGKDRTGIVAAVLLSLLGVRDHDVAADYALTSEIMPEYVERAKEWLAERGESIEWPEHVVGAEAETMELVLAAVREEHGSIDAWATANGLAPDTITHLRAELLE